MELLYATQPGGMRFFGALIAVLLLASLVLAIGLIAFVDAGSGLIAGASLLASFAVVWALIPRRFEVWPEHLRIVFPLWGWDIPYESIETVRSGRWYEAYGFMGVRFATAPSQTVTVMRRNANIFQRPNLVISPDDREEFLRQLRRAMRR